MIASNNDPRYDLMTKLNQLMNLYAERLTYIDMMGVLECLKMNMVQEALKRGEEG